MRRLFGIGFCVAAISLTGCALGAPEDGVGAEEALGQEQSGLELESIGQIATAGLDPELVEQAATAVEAELATQAEQECDSVCAVREWFTEERYDEAREALETELAATPADLEMVLMLATVELADEEYSAAYALTDDHLRAAPGSVRLMEKRAAASLLADDVATAAEDYTQLIEQLQTQPEDIRLCDAMTTHCATSIRREAKAWVGLATARYNQGELAEAESIARDVLGNDLEGRIHPAYSEFILALSTAKRGDDEASMAHYEAILESIPNEPATLNNIGGIYYRAGDLETAREYHVAAYENAGSARRTAAIAWSNVAEIDMLEGEYETAEDKWLETLSMSKRFAAGHFSLAVLYDLLDRGEEAARHMATALELDENGVTRWNTCWFTPDWKLHFDALVTESNGGDATSMWERLSESEIDVLRQSALRHVGEPDDLATIQR